MYFAYRFVLHCIELPILCLKLSQTVDCPSLLLSFLLAFTWQRRGNALQRAFKRKILQIGWRASLLLPTYYYYTYVHSLQDQRFANFQLENHYWIFWLIRLSLFFRQNACPGAWLSGVLAMHSKKKQGYKTTLEKHILQARCVQYCNTAPFHFG